MSETETRTVVLSDRDAVVDAETLRQLRSDKARYKSDRDEAWARCAAEECECVESVNAEAARLRGVVEAVQALARQFYANERAYLASIGEDMSLEAVAEASNRALTYRRAAHAIEETLVLAPASSSGEGGERERLLAQRDALIAQGVPESELEMPAGAPVPSGGQADGEGVRLTGDERNLLAFTIDCEFYETTGEHECRREADTFDAVERILTTRLAARPVLSREAVADLLLAHQGEWDATAGHITCDCGWVGPGGEGAHARHLADVLDGGRS